METNGGKTAGKGKTGKEPAPATHFIRNIIVADLAREYGFTDIDGRQPPAFEMDA